MWVIVQRVDGLPERGSIWERRCRLHLCSASCRSRANIVHGRKMADSDSHESGNRPGDRLSDRLSVVSDSDSLFFIFIFL